MKVVYLRSKIMSLIFRFLKNIIIYFSRQLVILISIIESRRLVSREVRALFFKRFNLVTRDGFTYLTVPARTNNVASEITPNLSSETIEGKEGFTFDLGSNCHNFVLPICFFKPERVTVQNVIRFKVIFNTGEELECQFTELNRFHYLNINLSSAVTSGKIVISEQVSSRPRCFIGNAIFGKKHGPIIVHLFVDAISAKFLGDQLQGCMPFSHKFFSTNGSIFERVFAQAEWTLSSIASVFTGLYTYDHGVYHPRDIKSRIRNETIASSFKKNGFYTQALTNVPKLTGDRGFNNGFDRFVLAKKSSDPELVSELVSEIENSTANSYIFLGLFDTHECQQLSEKSTQTNVDASFFKFKKLEGNSKSVDVAEDHPRQMFYKAAIAKLDRELSRIYDSLEAQDRDFVVALHSDHGVNFIGGVSELLSAEREQVPMMIVARKNNEFISFDSKKSSIKELRSLGNMLFEVAGLRTIGRDDKYFGYALTESIYPGNDYKVAVRSDVQVLFYQVPWAALLPSWDGELIEKVECRDVKVESKVIDYSEMDPALLRIARDCYEYAKLLIGKEYE
jgi:hypothetical protein